MKAQSTQRFAASSCLPESAGCARQRRALRPLVSATLLATALIGTALISGEAEACGGLFCSAANPVEQTAERIVFARNPDQTVTAIIEIQYQGPSEKFAWVLPMPGEPKIDVSDKAALDAIDSASEPEYELQYDYGDCIEAEAQNVDAGAFGFPFADAAAPAEQEPAIRVLDTGTAGPYDFVVISPSPDLEKPAQSAIEWLTDNGYDVGATAPEVLSPYLAQKLNLVAFRLTKGNDVGAIRPVMITYDGDAPSIPIRPTAVAARENMGIRVFILGKTRALSSNYLDLELNENRINWFDWKDGYDELVSAAADEAGGRGFITEFAGKTDAFSNSVWSAADDENWTSLLASKASGADLLVEASNYYRRQEGFRRAVEASVTLPPGIDMSEFSIWPAQYLGEGDPEVQATFDEQQFLQELEREVVVPLRAAQQLLDSHPYMSRLYTTLSPEEMVEDPVFDFYDLPEVSRHHEAQLTYQCPENPEDITGWTIELEDGTEIGGSGEQDIPNMNSLPALALARNPGSMEPLVDNRDEISDTLEKMAVDDFVDGGTKSTPPAKAKDSQEAMTPADGKTTTKEGESSTKPKDESARASADKESNTERRNSEMDAGVEEKKVEEEAEADDGFCSLAEPGKRSRRRLPLGGLLLALAAAGGGLRRKRRGGSRTA